MIRMGKGVALVAAIAALALGACNGFAQPPPPGSPLKPSSVESNLHGGLIVSYTVNVTLAYGAPSCFARPIVLVSGIFEPTININQGDTIKITLINNIPESVPTVSEGIALHYHGLRMSGPAAWFDGTSYVTLCPIAPGKNYTYQFEVNDPPGSYLWHDHNTGFKGDGLQGPFIVHPPRIPLTPGMPLVMPPATVPDLWSYDGDHTLFLSDWYHATTNSLLFQLNMPFDAAKVTNDTGAWNWVGNPQAVLVNGRGFYGDCVLFPGLGGSAAPPTCGPTAFTVAPGRSAQQPWASANNPGCSHSQFAVEAGKTYRMRLINGASLVFMTVCFEAHNVTLIAADAVPVAPVSTRCVDINSGQRVDVLLTADQPAANYWITVASQYRTGAPAGYAVLNYVGANASAFPTTATQQPVNITAWGTAGEDAMIKLDPVMLVPSANPAAALYLHAGETTLAPPKTANTFVVVDISQPLLEASGQIRWALNNVAMPKTPPCKPLMSLVQKEPRYLKRYAVNASMAIGTGSGPYVGMNSLKSEAKPTVYMDGISPVPLYPSVGLHVVELDGGKVIDVVVNNNPANSFNGDYRPSGSTRVAMEQHPFHLHGHRFWVLSRGNGTYNPALHAAGLNTADPAYRDTVTIPSGGWAYIRFRSNNPGIWPFHCHILTHVFMGQQLYFVEDIGKLAPPPAVTPKCQSSCRYNYAPYNKAYLRSKWGMSGWELPPLY